MKKRVFRAKHKKEIQEVVETPKKAVKTVKKSSKKKSDK